MRHFLRPPPAAFALRAMLLVVFVILSVPRVGLATNNNPLTLSPVRIAGVEVRDNDDDDGWADPGETVALYLRLTNVLDVPVTGIVARLSTTDDAVIACMIGPTLVVDALDAGETRRTEQAFTFVVAPVERVSSMEDLTATFNVRFEADGLGPFPVESTFTIDVDLDAVGGGPPTVWFEGFEDGLGDFTPMPLDDALNPPDDDLVNVEAGLINADGWRCQYSDPDWENSLAGAQDNCVPNATNSPDRFWFEVSGNRAFSGTQSLYWGAVLDPALGFSTPTAQVEAVRTAEPLSVGWRDVCETQRDITCASELDCPLIDGQTQRCVPVQPTLTFKQQVSMLDHRTHPRPEETFQRGVVMARLADADGSPVGHWFKLEPHVNPYDSQPQFFGCTFDPTDDGNTEEDFFDPADPERRFGPSSTCQPEYVFADQGQTGVPFDPEVVGGAGDGPGLEGASGLGTWIESKIDLSRFRGRHLDLRFLVTGYKLGAVLTYEHIFMFNPDPRDDGWWIDDIALTDAAAAPAALTPDDTDPSLLPQLTDDDADGLTCDNCPFDANPVQSDRDEDGIGDACDTCPDVVDLLQVDADADGAGAACDCADDSAVVYPGAPEVNDGLDNQCPGDAGFGIVDELDGPLVFVAGSTDPVLSWAPQTGAESYEVARDGMAGFDGGCVTAVVSETTYSDSEIPASNGVVHYLVRPLTPNAGSWGLDSAGRPRMAPTCPQ